MVTGLAEKLHKYAKHLEEQSVKVLAVYHAPIPARCRSDATSLFILPKQVVQSLSILHTLSPVYSALTGKPYLEPIFLNSFILFSY